MYSVCIVHVHTDMRIEDDGMNGKYCTYENPHNLKE